MCVLLDAMFEYNSGKQEMNISIETKNMIKFDVIKLKVP